MIAQTLFFTSPCHLSVKNKQLLVRFKDDRDDQIVPVEDVGFMVLENHAITLSLRLIELLNQYGIAVVFCDSNHMPCAALQTFSGHSTHGETARNQISASPVLSKQLWKKTVECKIANQASLLRKYERNKDNALRKLAGSVRSNDSENCESQAARFYWASIFELTGFARGQFGDYPNSFLNYGYAILRAATARALAGSGLFLQLGIFHRNKYNAFCLADDIMEPFRPFVDEIVLSCVREEIGKDLTTDIKLRLMQVLTVDTKMQTKTPLMLALTRTSASLSRSFNQKQNLLEYPVFE
jgi:CRISPR-associated protein Cas1